MGSPGTSKFSFILKIATQSPELFPQITTQNIMFKTLSNKFMAWERLFGFLATIQSLCCISCNRTVLQAVRDPSPLTWNVFGKNCDRHGQFTPKQSRLSVVNEYTQVLD